MTDSILKNMQRVIAVIDPELDTQPAIERLKSLAKVMQFEVMLVACDYNQYLVEGYYFSELELPKLREEYLQARKDLLENLAAPLRAGGLDVFTQAIWSYPRYDAIIDLVDQYKPDLVIQHAHRHGALSRMILTNDDWQLTRHCPVPVLMVKEKPWKPSPVILAAVDPMHARAKPSGLDHRILSEGQLFEAKLDGELFAVHAYGRLPLSIVLPTDAHDLHQEKFEALLKEFDIPTSQSRLIKDAPQYALQTAANELEADIVIVGSISRSFIKDTFIGNTTERVLDFLDCDVLLLRPDQSNS